MTSLRRDVVVNTSSNIALAVLGIVSGSLVSYRFGADGRGVVGAAQVVAALASSIGSIGIGDALLYAIASRGTIRPRLILLCASIATLGGAILGLVSGIVVRHNLHVGARPGEFVFFCCLVSAATGFFIVPLGALRGTSSFVPWNALRVGASMAWIIALVAGGFGSTVRLAYVAVVYASILFVIGVIAVMLCRRRLPPASGDARYPMRSLLGFGLPTAFASAPLLLNARVDQVALALAAPANTVGQYVAAAGYCWATVPLGQAITNLTATRVASEPDPERRMTTLRYLTGVGVTAVGASTLVAWIVAPFALRILNGPGFGQSVAIARVLLIGAGTQSISLLLEEGSRGLGRPKFALYAEVSGLAVMIALLVVAVHRGAVPTAIASTIGYLVSFVVISRSVARHGSMSVRHLVRPADPRGLRNLRQATADND